MIPQITIATLWLAFAIIFALACLTAGASPHPCSAVEKAYQIASTHYRPKMLRPTDELIYPHEADGVTAARLVSETYGVSCFVKPWRNL